MASSPATSTGTRPSTKSIANAPGLAPFTVSGPGHMQPITSNGEAKGRGAGGGAGGGKGAAALVGVCSQLQHLYVRLPTHGKHGRGPVAVDQHRYGRALCKNVVYPGVGDNDCDRGWGRRGGRGALGGRRRGRGRGGGRRGAGWQARRRGIRWWGSCWGGGGQWGSGGWRWTGWSRGWWLGGRRRWLGGGGWKAWGRRRGRAAGDMRGAQQGTAHPHVRCCRDYGTSKANM